MFISLWVHSNCVYVLYGNCMDTFFKSSLHVWCHPLGIYPALSVLMVGRKRAVPRTSDDLRVVIVAGETYKRNNGDRGEIKSVLSKEKNQLR